MPGYAHPKMIVSICGKLWRLCEYPKYTLWFTSQTYYILKNPTFWLGKSFFIHNSRKKNLGIFYIFHFQETYRYATTIM